MAEVDLARERSIAPSIGDIVRTVAVALRISIKETRALCCVRRTATVLVRYECTVAGAEVVEFAKDTR
jgi:hypothetical protein